MKNMKNDLYMKNISSKSVMASYGVQLPIMTYFYYVILAEFYQIFKYENLYMLKIPFITKNK